MARAKKGKKPVSKTDPQIVFRVSQEDNKRITELLSDVTALANKTQPNADAKFKKSEVLLDALYLGLLSLQRRARNEVNPE